MSDAAVDHLKPPRLTGFRQVLGFVRKELLDLVRQPRLLLVLVAGPFLILLLFAIGYDQTSVRLRTIFVGPEGSVYETAIESYGADVQEYVETVGYTSDVVSARRALEDGEADLVVVFPPDPAETILGGEQAVITVLHQKIDPLQQTAVEIAAQVAVSELNASVLEELVGEAQDSLVPLPELLDEVNTRSSDLRAAADAGDREEVDRLSAELRTSLAGVDQITSLSERMLVGLAGQQQDSEQLDALRSTLAETNAALDRIGSAPDPEGVRAAAADLEELSGRVDDDASQVVTIDPGVVTRPFRSDTENLLRAAPQLNDFFAPSAVSLLLQHLAVTVAALTLVRDERMGLFETYRVAPISTRHVLMGKMTSFLLVGGSVGAVLIAAVVGGLGVPLRGSVGSVAAAIVLVVVASLALGLLLSAFARTDTQAVQYAMLVLLAGMFFGGFFLSLDAFRFPIRLLSWLLPVTYAIRWLQDVMLRGTTVAPADVIGLASLTVVYGAGAWYLFSRRLTVR